METEEGDEEGKGRKCTETEEVKEGGSDETDKEAKEGKSDETDKEMNEGKGSEDEEKTKVDRADDDPELHARRVLVTAFEDNAIAGQVDEEGDARVVVVEEEVEEDGGGDGDGKDEEQGDAEEDIGAAGEEDDPAFEEEHDPAYEEESVDVQEDDDSEHEAVEVGSLEHWQGLEVQERTSVLVRDAQIAAKFFAKGEKRKQAVTLLGNLRCAEKRLLEAMNDMGTIVLELRKLTSLAKWNKMVRTLGHSQRVVSYAIKFSMMPLKWKVGFFVCVVRVQCM